MLSCVTNTHHITNPANQSLHPRHKTTSAHAPVSSADNSITLLQNHIPQYANRTWCAPARILTSATELGPAVGLWLRCWQAVACSTQQSLSEPGPNSAKDNHKLKTNLLFLVTTSHSRNSPTSCFVCDIGRYTRPTHSKQAANPYLCNHRHPPPSHCQKPGTGELYHPPQPPHQTKPSQQMQLYLNNTFVTLATPQNALIVARHQEPHTTTNANNHLQSHRKLGIIAGIVATFMAVSSRASL